MVLIEYDTSTGQILNLALADGNLDLTHFPSNFTLVDETKYPQLLNHWHYGVYNNGQITFNIPSSEPLSESEILANTQQAKIAQLGQALQNAIATFQSSAKGTTYTYLADEKSMTMLGAEYAYVRSSDYKGETVNWYTKEAGRISHTGAEIAQVFLDGRAYVANQYAHHDNLVAQVNAITLDNQTLDQAMTQLNAITW